MKYQEIIGFWFEELEPKNWWEKSSDLDQLIQKRFREIWEKATRCELFEWRNDPHGRLAEILILDQFSRNIFRDSPLAFSQDALALALAQEAVLTGAEKTLEGPQKAFLLLPYMHSESSLIHEQAMILFDQPGLEGNFEFEIKHKAIIDRFGRYPHRNKVLGRESTAEELEFLLQPDSSF